MNEAVFERLENEPRLRELTPTQTLIKLGFKPQMTLCDIGAGSGIFSVAASQISREAIWALDISENMLEIINQKKQQMELHNLFPLLIKHGILPLKDQSCDFVLLCTVFHEVNDKLAMLKEIRRIMKNNGNLIIIEFHAYETPFGPPVPHRISEAAVLQYASEYHFALQLQDTLSENFYILNFKKQQEQD